MKLGGDIAEGLGQHVRTVEVLSTNIDLSQNPPKADSTKTTKILIGNPVNVERTADSILRTNDNKRENVRLYTGSE